MIEIKPFFGWRYNLQKVRLEDVLAPPYDVVSQEEREQYLQRSLYNIFHLELGKDEDNLDRYTKAKRLWDLWRQEGILLREREPALYLYRLRFSWQGQEMIRRGFIALVRLVPWEKRLILPHEKTFNRVTEDRLKLLRATKAQFSQIFCLYHDHSLRSLELLEREAEPLFEVRDEEGFEHQISRVKSPQIVAEVSHILAQERLYIADGHHRYTTALQFMREMEANFGRDPLRCFHYMMMYLCPFEEPGLLVLPTHRLLQLDLSFEELRRRLTSYGKIEEISLEGIEARLKGLSPYEFIIIHEGRLFLFCFNEGAQNLTEHLPTEVRKLPVALFTHLMEEVFGVNEAELKEKGKLLYTPWVGPLLAKAKQGRFGFLLAHTPVQALEEVASAGLVMPHKSTYFYPKILTGTVLFEIDPEKGPPC